MKKILRIACLIFISNFLSIAAIADDEDGITSDHEWNVYTGMFDFSDDGKRSTLVGIQHQNESLKKKSFLGTLFLLQVF